MVLQADDFNCRDELNIMVKRTSDSLNGPDNDKLTKIKSYIYGSDKASFELLHKDMIYLLQRLQRSESMIEKILSDREENIDAAEKIVLDQLSKQYAEEKRNHATTLETCEILGKELANLRTWMRTVHKISDATLQIMENLKIDDVKRFLGESTEDLPW